MDVVSPILEKACASYVIKKLIDAAATYVRNQYYWKTDLQEEMQSLQDLLPHIQSIVGFTENRIISDEVSNPALIKWLWQFKDGIEEAEEVLDELDYLELKKKANRDKSRLSRTVDASVKTAKRLLKFDDILGRLRRCVKNLNKSASNVKEFLALVPQTGGIGSGQMQQEILPLSRQSRITSSLPGLSFKGRDEEKGKIIQYLLGESVEESEIQITENVHCLPLVAMGGMGKTALAQQVFDHFENVKKEHFDIKFWICDSLPDLDASSLMKKILKYSTDRSESGPLEWLPVKLKEKLHSKRFLLVLDDAWDDKHQKEWEKLCTPLLSGQKGSWIILTTRLKSVAKLVSKVIRGGTIEPMMLSGLSKDECRSLLYEHAFAGQDPNEFPLLKEIGKEIVEKLKGIPLLAKSIGGALNSKLEVDHWTSISRSEVWKMQQDLDTYEFIPALKLSYIMLPPRLKRCFSYCSIFPQDYLFNKQMLVCMWVAAGLIYSEESEEGSDEDIANYCFDILCNKSFFDVHTYNKSTFSMNDMSTFRESIAPYHLERGSYTMHDMLNGLACYVSRYECCRIVHDTSSRILNYTTIRHISISITSTNAQLHDLVKMVCQVKHLRTFWIQYYGDPQKLDDFIREACKSPRRIRVFIMQSYGCLESISNFVKLRFLDISGFHPRLRPPSLLPKFIDTWEQPLVSISISKFYFLQVLIADRDSSSLAKDANKLTNLRHLYEVHEDVLLSVAKVGKLTSLQKLCFAVGTEPGYRIDELMNMTNLRQLFIKRLSNVQSLEEANKVNLVSKSSLTSLELDWTRLSNPDDGESNPDDGESNPDGVINPDLEEKVLGALHPPPTVGVLIIRGYKGGSLAPWISASLSRLEYIQLDSCTSLEELPSLWKLRCLKCLKLNQMKAIRSLGCDFSDQMNIQFPALEELEFRDLPLWEEWNGAKDYIWFPRLRSFIIINCPQLKKVPDLPSSIEGLRMEYLGLEALPRSYNYKCSNGSRTFGGLQQFMSLEHLKIYRCPKIVQIGSIGEEDDNLLPPSLKELELGGFPYRCEDLASYLRGLTSLTTLSLSCSSGIKSLPSANELEHLTKLHGLHILNSKALTSPGGLYIMKSLKSLMIFNCPKFLSAEVESQKFLKDETREHAASSSTVFDRTASNEAASILPSSLTFLNFSISDISQESLGRCLQGLTSLRCLKVSRFRHLVSLPDMEYLRNLTALEKLEIDRCEELCELESLTTLVSLKELEIYGCPKLLAPTFSTLQNPATSPIEQSATLPSLEKMEIDNIFYLPNLPIPERLKTLLISNYRSIAKFTCFPSEIEKWLLLCRKSLKVLEVQRMPHLQSLPASLESFSSLNTFSITYVPELKSVPRMPASLKELEIDGCSDKLKKRCQENIGRDWPNINHIPHIYITVGNEDKEELALSSALKGTSYAPSIPESYLKS